jgi:drug/metabolite transporter (DMT)-like permease
MSKKVSEQGLLIAIVVSMFFWGLGWPSGKVLTGYSSPVNFAVYRYIIVVVALIGILLVMKIRPAIKKAGIPFVVISGILLGIYSYLFFLGLKNGAAGAGGVLVTTLNPIVAYAIGMVMTRKMPSRNESIGLLLGLIAGCVLLRVWNNHGIFEKGNIYFLLCACTWAIMSKFTARGGSYGTSLGFSLWQYVVTLVCLLPMLNVHEMKQTLATTDHVFWFNLFFSSACVTAGATTVYFYATTRLGAEKASSYIFMVPLAAAVSSWMLIGEKILMHTIIGGVLGMAAVYVMNKKSIAAKPATR